MPLALDAVPHRGAPPDRPGRRPGRDRGAGLPAAASPPPALASARALDELWLQLGFNWSDDIVIVSLYMDNQYRWFYYSSSPRSRQGGRADDQRARGPAVGAHRTAHSCSQLYINVHNCTQLYTTIHNVMVSMAASSISPGARGAGVRDSNILERQGSIMCSSDARPRPTAQARGTGAPRVSHMFDSDDSNEQT